MSAEEMLKLANAMMDRMTPAEAEANLKLALEWHARGKNTVEIAGVHVLAAIGMSPMDKPDAIAAAYLAGGLSTLARMVTGVTVIQRAEFIDALVGSGINKGLAEALWSQAAEEQYNAAKEEK